MTALEWPYPECHICGGNITTTNEWLHEITGYEKTRKRGEGGTNHVISRKRTGRDAHDWCARQTLKQENLF